MKSVEFAKRWRNRISETVVHEYSAGAKPVVSDEVAKAAFEAGVLKGDPVDAPVEKPEETKKKS